MSKFIDLDAGLPALLNKVKAWVQSKIGDLANATTTALSGKQDTIQDLATIRTGAGKGATALQPSDVSVDAPSTPDGTFTLNVGSNEYNVNLNHSHADMVKLMVDAGENLPDPEDMSEDTIYGEVEDGEITVIYLGGYPFYGCGGGSSTPRLISPANGSTIECGTNQGSGVEKTITVKGVNLTAALTVAVTGTGFSIKNGTSSISATDANAGTTLTIVYSGTSANATGALSFTSSTDGINSSITLEADYEDPYADIIYDKACNYASNYTDIITAQGYCMTPKYAFPVNHQLRIHFGFKDSTSASDKKGAAGWKTADGSGQPVACFTSDAGDTNTERNIPTSSVNNGNPPYTFIAATFKTSELDNCFLYDLTSQEWLFAGVNVDKSNPPT